MTCGDRGTATGTGSVYWDQLVFVVLNSNLMKTERKHCCSDPAFPVPTFTVPFLPGFGPCVSPVFVPVSIHLSGTWTPRYHEHTPYHPTSAWSHGFILHNRNGLCEMTWVEWGCGARLSRPKCFFFFLFLFCILCVCTPDSQSSVKENKLNIFKTDKSGKILYCLMCKKKTKKHCADVELPECSDTQHEEQKVCVKCSRRSSYCTICRHSAKCNQSWSFRSCRRTILGWI